MSKARSPDSRRTICTARVIGGQWVPKQREAEVNRRVRVAQAHAYESEWEMLERLRSEINDDEQSAFREMKRHGDYKKQLKIKKHEKRRTACPNCGWVARFNEKRCGKCGTEIGTMKWETLRSPTGPYDPKILED